MKIRYALFLIVLMFLSACATSNEAEILALQPQNLEPLQLVPSADNYGRRLDIIRQTYTKEVNDSTEVTKSEPYHVLGFDLGNGLFFDINQNLSLRADVLLGAPETDYTVREFLRPEKRKSVIEYIERNDSSFIRYSSGRREHYQHHVIGTADSLSRMYKKRHIHSIVRRDSLTLYRGRKRIWDRIVQSGENSFYVNKKKWKHSYELKNDTLFLENDYLVCLSEDGKTLRVFKNRRKKDFLLYTLRRNKNTLYVYNKHYQGKKYVFDETGMDVYSNRDLIKRYELEK